MKEEIRNLLLSVERPKMKELVEEYLDKTDYFTAPASTRFHGAHEGGLILHCHRVYKLLLWAKKAFNLRMENDTIIITAFLHDLCKAGAYKKTDVGYSWNQKQPPGHCTLSLERIEKYLELTDIEKEMIKYHMGMYGTYEFTSQKGEYAMSDLVNIYNRNKFAKLFYFCDDMSSQFLEV